MKMSLRADSREIEESMARWWTDGRRLCRSEWREGGDVEEVGMNISDNLCSWCQQYSAGERFEEG